MWHSSGSGRMQSISVVQSNHLHGVEQLRILQEFSKARHASRGSTWEPSRACRTIARSIICSSTQHGTQRCNYIWLMNPNSTEKHLLAETYQQTPIVLSLDHTALRQINVTIPFFKRVLFLFCASRTISFGMFVSAHHAMNRLVIALLPGKNPPSDCRASSSCWETQEWVMSLSVWCSQELQAVSSVLWDLLKTY